MYLPKLTTTLAKLSKENMKRFSAFVCSPYFGFSAGAQKLIKFCELYHPTFNEKNFNAVQIAKKSPELSSPKTQANRASEIVLGFEKFVAVEQTAISLFPTRQLQIVGLQRFNFPELATKNAAQLLAELNNPPNESVESFQNKHFLFEAMANGIGATVGNANAHSIEKVIASLDEFYALKKIRYQCEILNRSLFLKVSAPPFNENYLISILQPYLNQNHPYVFIFFLIYKMLSEMKHDVFLRHYKIFKETTNNINHLTYKSLLSEASGYLITLTHYWIEKEHQEYFYWIDWQIHHDAFLQNQMLNPVRFRNVVINAFLFDKGEKWLSNFIEKFQVFLPEKHKELNQEFVNGVLLLEQKKLKKAFQSFRKIADTEDVIFNCIIKRFQFITLYELDSENTEELKIFIESFTKFMQRNTNKIGPVLEANRLFIKYAKLLIVNAEKLNIEKLKKEERLLMKSWFIRKAKKSGTA